MSLRYFRMTMNAPLTKRVTIAALCGAFGLFCAVTLPSVVTVGDRPSAHTTSRPPDAGDGIEQRIAKFTSGFAERGRYEVPTRQERQAFTHALALLLDGDPEGARAQLIRMGFSLNILRDSTNGRRYAEVAEDASGPIGDYRGWGRVYVDLDHPVRWSVQVPHPVADARTELLGARTMREAPGGVLVLAGAHRNAGKAGAADVAHRADSLFHSVVEELTRRKFPGIQLHGFADESFIGYDAVVSTAAGNMAQADAQRLAIALRSDGLSVCGAHLDRCKLAGTENEQGLLAAKEKVRFLHVELNRRVRGEDTRLNQTAASLGRITEQWSRS